MTALYPLTTFEEFMLRDDCVEHPMTFFLRTDFQESVQASKLASAFDQVVRRHPIFWSRIVHSRRTGYAWQPDPSRIPTLQVGTGDKVGECPLKSYIDLEAQPGIRAFLDVQGTPANLWLQFHHSCCDGMAGIQFLHELWEAYAHHTSQVVEPTIPAPAAFPDLECAYSALTQWEKTKRLWHDLPLVGTFWGRRLISPAKPLSETGIMVDNPAYVEAQLPLTLSIRARLKRIHQLPTSVNDVLLRDIFLALDDATKSNPLAENGWIRLCVPMNLRKRGAPSSGCRNNMSLVFVDRQRGHSRRKEGLLRTISDEMARIKRHRMGLAMLRVLHWSRNVPSRLSREAIFNRKLSTAVVSNLGRVFPQLTKRGLMVAGDVTISGLGFLVPIRKGTPLAFGVLTYANQLTLCLQYDAQLIERHRAEELLTNLVRHLDDSLTGDASTSPPSRIAA